VKEEDGSLQQEYNTAEERRSSSSRFNGTREW
jgi:hypothetical protein